MPLLRFIPEATKIDFVKARFVAFAIDGLLLVASIASIMYHGFNLGIDFTGGVLLEAKAAHVIDIGTLRGEVNSLGFKDSQIQYFGGGECDKPADSCVLIRVQPKSDQDAQAAVSAMKQKLGKGYDYRRADVVGPKVSEELFHDGVLAMLLAVVAIGGWVAIRFEWQYGISAAFATGHDVLVTAGLFSIAASGFHAGIRGRAAHARRLFDQRYRGGVRPHS